MNSFLISALLVVLFQNPLENYNKDRYNKFTMEIPHSNACGFFSRETGEDDQLSSDHVMQIHGGKKS